MLSATAAKLMGRYRVERLIGEGPAAIVYQAFDDEQSRALAVKALRAAVLRSPSDFEAYLRTTLEIAKLHLDATARLFDHFEHDGRYYVVSGWVDGQKIAGAPFDTQGASEKLVLLVRLLDAVAALHARGCAHGNLKPSNIFFQSAGTICLTDAGMRLPFGARAFFDKANTAAHTYRYCAPEQRNNARPEIQGDVFAVGALAFEWLTGSPYLTLENADVTAFSDLRFVEHTLPARVPGAIADVIARALAHDPALRFRDAGEMRQALVAAQSAPQMFSISRGAVQGESTAAPSAPAATKQHAGLRFFAVGLCALALLLFAGVLLARSFSANSAMPAPTIEAAPVVPTTPPVAVAPAPPTLAPATPTSVPPTEMPTTRPPATATFQALGDLKPFRTGGACQYGLRDDGLYRVRSRADQVICGAVLPVTVSNARIQARIKMLSGDGIGSGNTILIFGYKSPQDFFGVTFTRVGRLYGIAHWKNSEPESIVFYNWAPALQHPDSEGATEDDVLLQINGTELFVYVNGTPINTFSLEGFGYRGGQVGVGVYTTDPNAQTVGAESLVGDVVIQPLP